MLLHSKKKKKSKPVDENIVMALNEVINSINMYYGIFPIKVSNKFSISYVKIKSVSKRNVKKKKK